MEPGRTTVRSEATEPAGSGLAPHHRAVLRTVPDLDRIPTKLCPEGHPNDPAGTACRICERGFDAAAELIHMAPIALARLIFEDGTAVDLTGDLIIGRCPLADESAEAGDTLTVTGPQVSRRHLMVRSRGWRLSVQDCDSTNGTFIARAGVRGRRRVPVEEATPLRVGDTLHFGTRQALVIDARPG